MIKKKTTKKVPIKKKTNSIVFASYPKKVVDKKYINSLWTKYFNGTLEDLIYKRKDISYISRYNKNVKIIPLSPTIAVTIRKCSIHVGENYLKTATFFKKKLVNLKLKHSEVLLADIVDYKKIKNNYYIMERIIPSISVSDLKVYLDRSSTTNRFQESFVKKLKGIDTNSFRNNINIAYAELKEELNNISKLSGINIDKAPNNVIIIDYNKDINRFKFGLIDFMGKGSESF